MRRLGVLLGLLLGLGAGPAMACAVATQLDLRNATGQTVQRLAIQEEVRGALPEPSWTLLPATGLAPGASFTVSMPSCLGMYVATATLADGTVRRYPGLDARRIRALELR